MCLKKGEEKEKENKEKFVHKEDLILKFDDLNMRNEFLKDHPKIAVVILIFFLNHKISIFIENRFFEKSILFPEILIENIARLQSRA